MASVRGLWVGSPVGGGEMNYCGQRSVTRSCRLLMCEVKSPKVQNSSLAITRPIFPLLLKSRSR